MTIWTVTVVTASTGLKDSFADKPAAITTIMVSPIALDAARSMLAKHTGQTIKKIEKDTDRDNFLDATSAKSYGIVDKILNERGPINGK